MTDFKDFKALVTWATWYTIESFVHGEELYRTMHHVVSVARQATFEKEKV